MCPFKPGLLPHPLATAVTLEGHKNSVYSMDMTRNGSVILTGGTENVCARVLAIIVDGGHPSHFFFFWGGGCFLFVFDQSSMATFSPFART